MHFILPLMAVISFPLMLLNFLGGIVGGIWLAILGEWGTLGIGVVGLFGGALFCSLLLLPGMALTVPSISAWERGGVIRIVVLPFMIVGHLWTYLVMTAWGFGAFIMVLKGVSMDDNVLPYGLWAYAVSTSPWSYMAQKDIQSGNDHGTIPLFFLQVGCACLIFGFGFKLPIFILAFWALMAISMIVGLLRMIIFLRSETK